MPISEDHKLAYSTEFGGTCKKCNKTLRRCRCPKETNKILENTLSKDSIVHIRHERNKRRGKSVIILSNIPYDKSQLKCLCSRLKQLCSSGGTVKGTSIEIQGENEQAIRDELDRRGLRYKLTDKKTN